MIKHVPTHYSQRVVAMLTGVLDEAWRELINNHDSRVLDHSLNRDGVARRILESALLGERSPSRLKVEAMAKTA